MADPLVVRAGFSSHSRVTDSLRVVWLVKLGVSQSNVQKSATNIILVHGWSRGLPRHQGRLHLGHQKLLNPETLLGKVALSSFWGRTGSGVEALAESIMVDVMSDEFFRHALVMKGAGGCSRAGVGVVVAAGWGGRGAEGGRGEGRNCFRVLGRGGSSIVDVRPCDPAAVPAVL